MLLLRTVLAGNGIKFAGQLICACQVNGVSVAAGCVLLVKETGGGKNVYGHDAVLCGPVGGTVTEANYCSCLANRARCGVQGVGPMQLTYPSLQGWADREGGCWRPEVHVLVGIAHFGQLLRAAGDLRTAFRRYSGSGPAAEPMPIMRCGCCRNGRTLLVPPRRDHSRTSRRVRTRRRSCNRGTCRPGTNQLRALSLDPIGRGRVFPPGTLGWLRLYGFDREGDHILGQVGGSVPVNPFKITNRTPFLWDVPAGTLAVELGYSSRVPLGASVMWLRT